MPLLRRLTSLTLLRPKLFLFISKWCNDDVLSGRTFPPDLILFLEAWHQEKCLSCSPKFSYEGHVDHGIIFAYTHLIILTSDNHALRFAFVNILTYSLNQHVEPAVGIILFVHYCLYSVNLFLNTYGKKLLSEKTFLPKPSSRKQKAK